MNLECHGEPLARILAPIEAYVRGLRDADAGALETAFDHAGATVAFSNGGQITYSPVAAAIPRWVSGGPLQPDEISSRLLGLSALSETLCVATCEMRLKSATYRDVLTLARIGDGWKIVSKSFVRLP